MTDNLALTIDGNPGAALRGTDPANWEGATSAVTIESFIYHPESATEAQLEIVIAGFEGEQTAASAELTYEDLLALRTTIDAIIARVRADGRDRLVAQAEDDETPTGDEDWDNPDLGSYDLD